MIKAAILKSKMAAFMVLFIDNLEIGSWVGIDHKLSKSLVLKNMNMEM